MNITNAHVTINFTFQNLVYGLEID